MTRTSVQDTLKDMLLINSGSFRFGIYSINKLREHLLWHLTGFYENRDTSLQAESWKLLKELSGLYPLPWLVIEDFNEIICSSEKEGTAIRPNKQMACFNEAIDFYNLREVGFVGPKYTWLYQKQDGSQIRERLDRALATQDQQRDCSINPLQYLTMAL